MIINLDVLAAVIERSNEIMIMHNDYRVSFSNRNFSADSGAPTNILLSSGSMEITLSLENIKQIYHDYVIGSTVIYLKGK